MKTRFIPPIRLLGKHKGYFGATPDYQFFQNRTFFEKYCNKIRSTWTAIMAGPSGKPMDIRFWVDNNERQIAGIDENIRNRPIFGIFRRCRQIIGFLGLTTYTEL